MEWRSESVPAWFQRAVEQPTQSHYAQAAGARIHYLSWNHHETHKPGLLFLHGFRGHAQWWSWVAPYFAERFRVFALDFSGMGSSDAREQYDPRVFTEDIAAVIRDAELVDPTVVGHSFGGGRLMRLCAEQPSIVKHAIVVDSYVQFLDDSEGRPNLQVRPRKVYATYAEAKARYRLTPPETTAAPYVLDYIAHHSIEQCAEGFRWRFADNLGVGIIEQDGADVLRRVRAPVTYLFGERSRFGSKLPERIVSHIEGARGPIGIPEAHHHVMLDEPLSLVAALRALLF